MNNCNLYLYIENQVTIITHQSKICPEYSFILHFHAAVAQVHLKKILRLIDRQTGETTRKNPKFINQDQVAIARFELTQPEQVVCMEEFKHFS